MLLSFGLNYKRNRNEFKLTQFQKKKKPIYLCHNIRELLDSQMEQLQTIHTAAGTLEHSKLQCQINKNITIISNMLRRAQ